VVNRINGFWIPACAGMTDFLRFFTFFNTLLTGDQIKELLNNKTIDGHDVQKGWDSKIYADSNGDWIVKFKSGEQAGSTNKPKNRS
jgi:hypothetical protein